MKKKILSILLVMILSLVLVSCKTDTEKPVISGTRDFILEITDLKPNYLEGITVTDNEDKDIVVTVDDSDVKINVPGTYELIYKAIDRAQNETIVKVNVVVKNEDLAPNILGAKDYFLVVNEKEPNYLEGITVTDDYDTTLEASVDSSKVVLDKAGVYELVYTAKDSLNNETVLVKSVTVFNNDKEKEAYEFVNKTDFSSIIGNNLGLNINVSLPDVATPNETDGQALGIIFKGLNLDVDVKGNLSSYEDSLVVLKVRLNIGSGDMIAYSDKTTYQQMTGLGEDLSWIRESHLEYTFILIKDKLYVSFEDSIDFNGFKMTIAEVLQDPMASMAIPASAKPMVESLKPAITKHREFIDNFFTEENYDLANGIISMIPEFAKSMITPDLFISSPFDLEAKENQLVVSTEKALSEVVDLSMLDLFLPEESAPIIKEQIKIALSSVSGLDIKLSKVDNILSKLEASTTIKLGNDEIKVSVTLNTKDVELGKPVVEEYTKVDELTLVKTIKSLIVTE